MPISLGDWNSADMKRIYIMKKERNLLRSGKLLATIGLLLGLSASPTFAQSPDSTSSPQELTLDAAIRIALTESTKVRIGDMEVQKQQYSLNTIYGKLFPALSFRSEERRVGKECS